MASDSEAEVPRLNGIATAAVNDHVDSPLEPSTPLEGPSALPDSSQVTLPSTEIPPSPSAIDPNESFKTEVNDDRDRFAATVIPSSLTPPPSTQVEMHNGNAHRAFSQSQQSNYFSPPPTILVNARNRALGVGEDIVASSDYVPPSSQQIADASADELRALLQTSVGETQKLKTETAHHKLQYNLLSLQADEEAKRADVEHEMLRREIDALRMAEHSRQARRELSAFSEALQTKYLDMKDRYDQTVDEVEILGRRLKSAKRIIQQKDEEIINLVEDRAQLLNRIRENREHFHTLCSPGGLFHSAMTPKQAASPAAAAKGAASRGGDRETESGHRLSTLLEVISQDNNSAPSTPIMPGRSGARHVGKHHRNAQSMSSLPTTPIHRPRGEHAALLPSANLLPQTEPAQRHGYRQYEPATPTPKADRRRSSRESTISADDNEELARQAMKSFTTSRTSLPSSARRERDPSLDMYDSQASQAAREMLLRQPRGDRSFTSRRSAGSRDGSPQPVDRSASSGSSSKLQAQLFSNLRGGSEKRKFSGHHVEQEASGNVRPEQGSPPKRSKAAGEDDRFGLGIQYSQ